MLGTEKRYRPFVSSLHAIEAFNLAFNLPTGGGGFQVPHCESVADDSSSPVPVRAHSDAMENEGSAFKSLEYAAALKVPDLEHIIRSANNTLPVRSETYRANAKTRLCALNAESYFASFQIPYFD